MDGQDPERALIVELRALANAPADAHDFWLTWEGLRVNVVYSGGSSSMVRFVAKYDEGAARFAATARDGASYRGAQPTKLTAIRPMKISLSRENALHVEGKAAGIDVEHQTGDATFDAAVYIDAPSADPLKAIFENATLRAAILDLFALDFTSIQIDSEYHEVIAHSSSFATLREVATPGRRALDAFVRMATSLPPVRGSGDEHPVDPLRAPTAQLRAAGIVLFCVGTPMYFLLRGKHCEDDMSTSEAWGCMWPGIPGVMLGLIAAYAAARMAQRSLGRVHVGTSSSSARISSYSLSLGFFVFTVVSILLNLVMTTLTR